MPLGQGGQFRAKKAQRLLKNNGLVGSMGRVHDHEPTEPGRCKVREEIEPGGIGPTRHVVEEPGPPVRDRGQITARHTA